jgi:dihydroflavonol-4-reductase
MSKIVAVTGANGHIGNVICRLLVEQGYQVRALYHSDKKSLVDLHIELIQGDILNLADVTQLVKGCEVVIHCAGIISIHGDPDGRVFKTNTEGSHNILKASLESGVSRIIHVSSVHAVQELPHTTPYDESRPYKTAADAVYDYSKAKGEQILLEGASHSPLEIVILRPSSVLGPFDFKPSLLGAALLDFYKQKIPFLPEGGYDFVDVRDVAQAAVNAIAMGRDEEAYVLSGTYYNFRKFAKVIHKVTGKKVPRKVIPYRWLKRLLPLVSLYAKWTRSSPAFTKESIDVIYYGHPHMDHSKAKKELHFSARSLEESLHDFYAWQKKMGNI